MKRADSFEKTLMLGNMRAGGEGDDRMRWLDGIIDSMDTSFTKLRDLVKSREAWHVCCNPWGCKDSDMTEWLALTETEKWSRRKEGSENSGESEV